MLSTYDNPTYIARAVALGASDYVLKGSSREDLVTTIETAAAGESPSRAGELRRIVLGLVGRALGVAPFPVAGRGVVRRDDRPTRVVRLEAGLEVLEVEQRRADPEVRVVGFLISESVPRPVTR